MQPIVVVLTVLLAASPTIHASSTDSVPGSHEEVLAVIQLGAPISWAPVYDGWNGNLYISGSLGPLTNGTVTVLSGATNTIVASATVGVEPEIGTVDAANGNVFIPNFSPGCTNCPPGTWLGSPNVTVISGTTNSPIADIPTGTEPGGAAFDPSNGNLYVPADGVVTVVSGASDSVVTTIPSGGSPQQALFDVANGDIYVLGPSQLTVIQGSSNTVIDSIPLGPEVGPMLVDGVTGDLYVAYVHGTQVVSGSTNTVVQNLSTSFGTPGFVDPQGDVYFLRAGNPGSVSVLAGTSNAVLSTFPIGAAMFMAEDPSNGDIFSVASSSSILNITSVQTHRLVQTLSIGVPGFGDGAPVYDPGNGDVYVMVDSASRVAVIGNGTLAEPAPSTLSTLLEGLGAGALLGGSLIAGLLVVLRRQRIRRAAPEPPRTVGVQPSRAH